MTDGVEKVDSIGFELRNGRGNSSSVNCMVMRNSDKTKDELSNRVIDFLIANNGIKRDGTKERIVAGIIPNTAPFIAVVALVPNVEPRELAKGIDKALGNLAAGMTGALQVCIHPAWPLDPYALYLELKCALWTCNDYVSKPRPAVGSVRVCHQSEPGSQWRGPEVVPLAEMRQLSMELLQAPANILTPATFADRVKAVATPLKTIQIIEFDETKLREMGMQLILATADGSVNRPRVLVVEYLPIERQAPIALVGKGVTFDSGGISIKPAKDMHMMKTDMGGAGICVSTVLAAAKQKLRLNMVAVVGLVENMPSGSAYRPGDVIKSYSGKMVEILDTDAEGRNVLADLMWYTGQKYRPPHMITVATLTGAIISALGHEWAGLYTKDSVLSGELLEAADSSSNKLWRMPLDNKTMATELKSPVADLRHMVRGRGAGSIYAAMFLNHFVHSKVGSWAHIDCAGTVYNMKKEVPTGWGPVLLNDWLVAVAKKQQV